MHVQRVWRRLCFLMFGALTLTTHQASAKHASYRHSGPSKSPPDANKQQVATTAARSIAEHTPAAFLPSVPRIVLWRLNGLGLSEGIRRSLEALVLSHLRQMPQKQIVEPEVMRQKLDEPAFAELERCHEGLACLRQCGAAVSADIVVYGTISALGNDYSLNLRALKVADGQELGRQVATLSGNLDQLIPQMRRVSYNLLAPDAVWGSLMIDTALAGIEVRLDNVKQATTPWNAPVDHLKPGPHTVRLDGFGSTHSEIDVEVVAFETSQVQVELSGGPVRAMQSTLRGSKNAERGAAPAAAVSPVGR